MFDRVGFSLDIRASSVRSMNRGGGGDGEQLSLSLATFSDFSFHCPFKSDFDFLHFGALPSDPPPTDQHWAILWPSFLQFVQMTSCYPATLHLAVQEIKISAYYGLSSHFLVVAIM